MKMSLSRLSFFAPTEERLLCGKHMLKQDTRSNSFSEGEGKILLQLPAIGIRLGAAKESRLKGLERGEIEKRERRSVDP